MYLNVSYFLGEKWSNFYLLFFQLRPQMADAELFMFIILPQKEEWNGRFLDRCRYLLTSR